MSPKGWKGVGEANMNINNETCPSVVSKMSNAQVFPFTHFIQQIFTELSTCCVPVAL